ncbi:MAG: hypothetical protein ABID84_06010 [Chloroflexota bacterium]
MTSYAADKDGRDLSSLFSPQLEGKLRPWSASQMGLQYPGEVIVASRWNDAWGKELTDDRYFRIVLLTSRQRSFTADLRDARIVVCIPAQDVLHQRHDLDRELRSIAEARGLYTVGRQADSSALRSTLDQREAELRDEFLGVCSRSYGSGQIRNTVDMNQEAEHIFASQDPTRWLQDLAGVVLTRVYPTLPIDQASFPRTLLETDLPALFDGFLADVPQLPVEGAIISFAVGLGLAQEGSPSAFDPRGCAVFGLVQQELEHKGPRIPVSDLARLLGHSYGLPLPLMAFFLLAFVKHSHPETELDLAPESSLTTTEGGPFPGDRLTWDLVGRIRWHQDMEAFLTCLHLPEPPTWNTALSFIQMIDPEAERAAPHDITRKEAALLSKLGELGESARQAQVDIQPLLEEKDLAEVEDRLQALVALGGSADFGQFYHGVRQSFRRPRSLATDLHLPAKVLQLKAIFPEIAAVRSYLKEMSFGPSEGALSLDHQALAYETNPAHILESAELWPGVKGRFERLRRTYRDLYIRHHAQYRKEVSTLWARLQHALPLVEALEEFNSIPELGPPVGEELPYQFEQLNTTLRMCPAQEEDVTLEDHPACLYCGLRLSEGVPYPEVEALLMDVGQGVQEQNRRLSLHGIQQILEQGDEQMVDKLIKIVRMADLIPLTNALSPQVLAFLRPFLASR